MFVLVKRDPKKAVIGERGDGVLLDGNGEPLNCTDCSDRPATRRFEYRDPDNCTALAKRNPDGLQEESPAFVEVYCEECYEHFENIGHEGYFYCEGCGEYHIENYSWELFYTWVDEEQKCLACAEDYYADHFDDFAFHKGDEVDLKDALRLGGHQRSISNRFLVLEEFSGVSGYSDSPTGTGTVLRALESHLAKSRVPVALAVTNAYQFCVDVAIVRLTPKRRGKVRV